MRRRLVLALLPVVFCFYIIACFEIDFGTHLQTWHDDYDTYIVDSSPLIPDLQPVMPEFFPVAILTFYIAAFILVTEPVILNIAISAAFNGRSCKYILNHSLLI